MNHNPSHRLRVRGPLACFTRPELKAERVSYPLITPSAARGVFEAVLWKPAIRWHIDRIDLLAPIKWIAFRRNEVNSRASAPSSQVIEKGGAAPLLIAEEDRAQRNTVALRDVDYLIHGHFEMTERAGPGDNPGKFAEMFKRRLANGQHFSAPYLGCREFVAEVTPINGNPPEPVDDTRDLGRILFDIDYGPKRCNRPLFFEARLERGTLTVPSYDTVLSATQNGGVK
jgi:CRISPR-associated protein Cas5d